MQEPDQHPHAVPHDGLRLHPVSFLFKLAGHLRQLVVPGLLVLVAGARGADTWQIWLMALFMPFALVSIAQALVFRYRMDPEELVLQSGLLFRQQRHVPYERIQNIDAVQNVVHRLFGVVDVRIETAGGQEPEAHLTVVSVAAFEALRAGVHVRRGQIPLQTQAPAQQAEPPATLLRLPDRELIISGLIQGRGLIVIGALFGLMWETGLLDRIAGAVFGETASGRGIVRQLVRAAYGEAVAPWRGVAVTIAAFTAFLLVTRVFSVGWSLVRLHGFTLGRSGADLRLDFGLFTRVAATIPIRRIQSVTVFEGPLHRLFGRVSVRVETAGGEADESVQLQRQWLAPVIRPADVPDLLQQVLPAVDAGAIAWQAVDRRGVRRARIVWMVRIALLSLLLAAVLKWAVLPVVLVLGLVAELDARRSVRALGWATSDTGVFFRSGWVWRRQTIAPFAKIQAVAVQASPFDRRLGMARVEVDTAGASLNAHRIDVPYLSRPTADAVAAHLAAEAARTTFRW